MRKRMRKAFLYSFLFCGFILVACQSKTKDKLIQINYGTEFGRCRGYCVHTTLITPKKVSYIDRVRGDTIKNPTKSKTIKIRPSYWDSLVTLYKSSNLMTLPDVIGCPGCADGGIEWIEIVKSSGVRKKIKFDYFKDMGQLNPLLDAINPVRVKNR